MIPEPKANSSPVVWVIAIPSPLHKVFEYLPPASGRNNPEPGARVRLPFAGREVTGIFIEKRHSQLADVTKLKQVKILLDPSDTLLSRDQLTLLQWFSDYYLVALGEAIPLGLSNRERKGNAEWQPPLDHLYRTTNTQGLIEAPNRAKQQQAALAIIGSDTIAVKDLEQKGISKTVIRSLVSSGLAGKVAAPNCPSPRKTRELELTDEQRYVCQQLGANLDHFQGHVLEGVTGSGKTEVYIDCIKQVIAQGRQTLVIVPEIGLTPQTRSRFEQALGLEVPVIHSGVSEAERSRAWSMARAGTAPVILGTRSSVFCSFKRLGLIIVDEEHDAAFKQRDHPRYSARDVAVKRAQLCNCPVILGSATPSLETLANSQAGKYAHHRLTQRPNNASLPVISTIDTRGLALTGGLSDRAIEQIADTVARQEQALLFMNRRGFAHSLQCEDCGWTAGCHQCDSSMVVHRNPPHLSCHQCESTRTTPTRCEQCHSVRLSSKGIGTEQLELIVQRLFKSTPLFRIDSDSVSNLSALQNVLSQIKEASSAILLGTQMLSKGHDFPRVTCVVVVDADGLLFSPDFRAEERLLQLLVQVSGRSGRAHLPGKVLIQTRNPDHPLIQQILDRPYSEKARELLARRRALGLPPSGALGLIRCDSKNEVDAIEFLTQLTAKVTTSKTLRLMGPMPTLMTRRAGLYRYQVIAHSQSRKEVHALLQQAVEIGSQLKIGRKMSWFVEIDPTETL